MHLILQIIIFWCGWWLHEQQKSCHVTLVNWVDNQNTQLTLSPHTVTLQVVHERRGYSLLYLFIIFIKIELFGIARTLNPGYQKYYARVIHIRDNRRGQPNRSAMEEPRSGGTAFMITVTPTPGKYALFNTDPSTYRKF